MHVGLALLALNVVLLLPGFLFREPRPDLTPFFPKEHPHGPFGFDARSAVEYVKALVLRRPNFDVWRVSFELVAASALLVLTAGRRGAGALRWVVSGLYALVLLVLVYHHAFAFTFETAPAIWEDVLLAENGLHFLADAYHPAVSVLAVAGLVLAVLGCLVLVARVFAVVQRAAVEWPWRQRLIGSAVLLGWGLGSLAWFGVERNDPVVQLPSKALAANYAASVARRARVQEVFGPVSDRRYQTLLDARLDRRPTVHLLMIEAYGQRLVSDPQMKEPFRALTTRAMERLAARGYRARTAYSRAPIFGGRSWLSIGTVQTGVRLEQPSLYKMMEAVSKRLPTLTRFFRMQGYPTLSLQPGNRIRLTLPGEDVFERDDVLEAAELGYTGTLYDWGQIPDQYSLNFYRQNVLAKAKPPYFSFFMSVSTHYNWPAIPFATDWRTLNTPEQVVPLAWEPIPGIERIAEGKPRRYFEAVVYEWRALLDFIEQEPDPDAIFIIVGDHQPLIERTTNEQFDQDVAAVVEQQSLNTPVHVIARDEAFVRRFEARGFTEGLFAEPWTGGLKHEGLFSLFVTELVGAYGATGHEARVRYLPDGVGVSTLAPEP